MRAVKTVLVVDDSATIRRLIKHVLEPVADLDVIGEAQNALEAQELVKKLKPDVLSLDIEMPGRSGLEFLERLMTLRPMPVLVVSSLVGANSAETIKALSLGAVDVFEKPGPENARDWQKLPDILRGVAFAKTIKHEVQPKRISIVPKTSDGVIVIGASTGGVDALETVLSHWSTLSPPTLITQHMPASFLESLANRFNRLLEPRVQLAQNNQVIEKGHIYIAPGGAYHMIIDPPTKRIVLQNGAKVSGHRPSVDMLFHSASQLKGSVCGALLTGMGRDGAQGLLALHKYGKQTFTQNKETCVVHGMPRVANEICKAHTDLSLCKIGPALHQALLQKAVQV